MEHKSVQYRFAYDIFPDIVFNSTGVLLSYLFKGEEKFNKLLNNVWVNAKSQCEGTDSAKIEKEEAIGFEFYVSELQDNAIACVIKMPLTDKQIDAKGICCIIGEDTSVRYFVYKDSEELHNKDEFMVMELTKDGEHHNYGVCACEKTNMFLNNIRELCI